MRIWYDVSGLTDWTRPQLGGIERTTTGILEGLADHAVPLRLVHVARGSTAFTTVDFAALPEAVRRHLPAAARLPWPAASPASGVPFAAGDVLLSLGGTFTVVGHPQAVDAARCAGARIVRLVYDLIPATKPQWVPASRVWTSWTRHVLGRSDLILAISRFTAAEAERFCRGHGMPVPSLEVIRLADVLAAARPGAAPPLPRFVPQQPFFLCVSTLDVRKNHRGLYEAWRVLAGRRPGRCPDLVCVGAVHGQASELLHEIRHDRDVNRHIHVLDDVHDAELGWYYRHCTATIYPSKYEGWGLPIAESLGLGRLCIAAHAASMPEISADLPEWFEPHDTARLVAIVERSLDDPAWRQAREQAICRSFRPTAWSETAARILEALGGLEERRAVAA
jgi:glycosyltransferase involved in cell wall biosynthesis